MEKGTKYRCLGMLWHSLRREQRTMLRWRSGAEWWGWAYHSLILWLAYFSFLPYASFHIPILILVLGLGLLLSSSISHHLAHQSESHSHTVLLFIFIIYGIVSCRENSILPSRFCDGVLPTFQTHSPPVSARSASQPTL